MHPLLTFAQEYWANPDLNSMQLLGKDSRALLGLVCQKIFFEKGHSYYHYGHVEVRRGTLARVLRAQTCPVTVLYTVPRGGTNCVQTRLL